MEKQTLHFGRSCRKLERQGRHHQLVILRSQACRAAEGAGKGELPARYMGSCCHVWGSSAKHLGWVSRAKSWEEELDMQQKRVSSSWKLLDTFASIGYHIGQQNDHQRIMAAVSLLPPKFHRIPLLTNYNLEPHTKYNFGKCSFKFNQGDTAKPPQSTLCHPGMYINA